MILECWRILSYIRTECCIYNGISLRQYDGGRGAVWGGRPLEGHRYRSTIVTLDSGLSLTGQWAALVNMENVTHPAHSGQVVQSHARKAL